MNTSSLRAVAADMVRENDRLAAANLALEAEVGRLRAEKVEWRAEKAALVGAMVVTLDVLREWRRAWDAAS